MNSKNIFFLTPLLVVIFFGLAYASMTLFSIPDYDELAYVMNIQNVKLSLYNLVSVLDIPAFPISHTNTLNTYFMALLEFIIPHSYATFILNLGYFLFMYLVLKRSFNQELVFLYLIILSANFYFIHLFGTYISELSVGVLLVSIMALCFFDNKPNRTTWLISALSLFILVRTINFIFLLGFLGIIVAAYLTPGFRESFRPRIKSILKGYLGAILVTLPFTIFTIPSQISYIVNAGTGDQAENWQNMIGISSKGEIPLYILNTLTHYNFMFVPALVIIFIVFIFTALFIRNKHALKESAIIFSVLSMVVIAFSNANSSNIMVIFWVYALGAFLLAYMLYFILSFFSFYIKIIVYVTALIAMLSVNFFSYADKHRYHDDRAEIYTLSKKIFNTIETIENSHGVFLNYSGIGPLDIGGIGYHSFLFNDKYKKNASIDTLSYKNQLSYYIENAKQSNILILANRNFLWQDYARYIGIDRHIAEIYKDIEENAQKYGFYPYKKYNYDGDPERFIQIYVKPFPKIHMPYAHTGADWLSDKASVMLIPENGIDFSKFQLVIDVEIPRVKEKEFKPPFELELLNKAGKVVDKGVCYSYGYCTYVFDLEENYPTLFLSTKNTFIPPSSTFEFSVKDWLTRPFEPKPTPDRKDTRFLSYKLISTKLREKQSKIISGGYNDGWIQALSEFSICPEPNHREAYIKGEIPYLFNALIPFNISIEVPEMEIKTKFLIQETGIFNVGLDTSSEDMKKDCFNVKITSSKAVILQPPDDRKISWLLKEMGSR